MSDAAPPRLDRYRLLGRSGLKVSPLCLGTMTFGTAWGWGADEPESRRMFDRYAEAGGNFIDTADFYTDGQSEELTGRFIASDRDRFVVATKYTNYRKRGDPNAAGNSRKSMFAAVEASLKRLNTDYIDLYWLHIWDHTTPVDELMRAFDDLVRQGKVLYLAISDTPAWKIAQLQSYAEHHGFSRFISTQVEYSLATRDVEREIVPMSLELGLGLLPWSPLAGGVLTGKYTEDDMHAERQKLASGQVDPFDSENRVLGLNEQKLAIGRKVKQIADAAGVSAAQVALQWLLTRPSVTSIILGARRLSQLDDNLACLDCTLSDEQIAELDEISATPLGFPHDFMNSPFIRQLVTAGCDVERPGG